MYLKALEIQGFKSFPDRTVLTFEKDLTAIVGPNGSGKSNISDALCWVMGEQNSRSLRGAKMEDIIFGGTGKRAQAGFAEVSLILDNQDGALPREESEIMVTRRYYRSGESEYYINRQTARLRDINELFMDTGLGREGYSSIGQGRIDEILSVKSEDRREIFEEAAGISRYRHRRDETERRLARAEENLLRIRDRISELELQVEPLRVQAEQAKAWLQCRDELRSLEAAVWLDSLQRIRETVQKLQRDRQSAEQQLQDSRTELDAMYRQAETLAEEMRNCDRLTESLREEIAQAEADRQKCDADVSVLQARFDNNTGNMNRIRKELEDQQQRSGSLTEQIAQRQERLDTLQKERAALQNRMEEAGEENLQLQQKDRELAGQMERQRQEQAETLARIVEKKAELEAAAASVQELLDRQTGAERDRADLRRRYEAAQEQADQCRTDRKQAEEQAGMLRNAAAGYELRIRTRTQKRDALQKQAQDQEVEQRTLTSRIRLYQDMEREYEGYSRAVKTVMQESRRGTLRNIHGPVSRLLKTDEEVALAVETALGNAAQHVVVSAEEDGKAAIEMLKRRDCGRATFLPLTVIRGKRLTEHGLETCAGFIGTASDLIRCDACYQEIFLNLLGRTVIVRRMDDALAMARRYQHRFRIITLDGQVLNAGGSMTGGSSGKNGGQITRAAALRRLLSEQEQLQQQQNQTGKALEEARRAVEEAQYEAAAARDQLRVQEDTILRLQGEESRQETLLAALQGSIENFDTDLQTVQERMEEGRKRIEDLRQEADALRQESERQAREIVASAQKQDTLSARCSEAAGKLTGLRLDMAALEAEEQSLSGSVAQLNSLADAMQSDQSQREQMLESCEEENNRITEELRNLASGSAALAEQLEELRRRLKTELDHRMDLEGRKNTCEAQTRDRNRDLAGQERECARLEQKQAASGLEEKQILDKMWDSYELTPTTAAEAAAKITDTGSAEKQIAGLRQKLSRLGNPNIGAIAEYARISERYAYLQEQESDAEQSKREITELLRSMTAEMTQIFRTEFEKINGFFRQTFVDLFGGGSAELVLEDPEDVLACGIEIRVQPPGKQLKTLTLLSGGEKALVAIALYFAIFRVRPAPFCMLDEIDAALDDRNVTRFVRYLRSLSGQTQFLVITHRRGTMEEADVLYGVTMQEQGVSRVVRMDLDRIAREMQIQ